MDTNIHYRDILNHHLHIPKPKSEGVSFEGVPFSVDKASVLDCQYEVHYWKEKKNKEKRLKLQGSRKIGCHAHIQTHTYTLYSDFQIPTDETCKSILSLKIQQLKEAKLQAARDAIANGGVKSVQKHFVSLPTDEAITGHPVGEAPNFCQ